MFSHAACRTWLCRLQLCALSCCLLVMRWGESSSSGVACRSRQGPSGVQTIRLTPDALHPGTIFFAFFNVDYFVHQRFSYVFLVRCCLQPYTQKSLWLLLVKASLLCNQPLLHQQGLSHCCLRSRHISCAANPYCSYSILQSPSCAGAPLLLHTLAILLL